ncbi:MAG: EAL domain-containing protein [Rubritepida sp.]|jgi:EAL domain-containing protein (putative c-di-GMP-specific phosphodiesterase class I)|nr:EAL domain-containing protein [Rubritepida sp.]
MTAAPAPAPPDRAERERYLAFALTAADLLVEVDRDGRITFAVGAFEARLGRSAEGLMGRPAAEILAPEDRDAFAAALAGLPLRGRLPPTAFHLANGLRSPFAVAGLHLPDRGAARLCLTFSPLPAPPPERAVGRAELLREAERRGQAGEGGSLSFFEVSGLDSVSAEAVQAVLAREAGSGVAARLAPDRFGLLLDADPGSEGLAASAERIGAALAEQTPGVALSLAGALPLEAEGLTPAQAARALRHGLAAFARGGAESLAAAGGAQGLGAIVSRVTARAGVLRRVVAERRFHLAFQPIVHLGRRQVSHYEALMRPEEGALEVGETTQDFIALAETVGLTEDLDLAVAAAALAATAAAPPGTSIAFNMSGLSAQSPGFRARLLALLAQNGRAASRAIVELTESAAVEDEGAAAATMRALRDRRVPVCLDDFGAGAAAFRYLQIFPVDYVKVDGGFVQAAASSERDRGLVGSMVTLAQNVGAAVVAEHVSTEEAARMMLELGVTYGQGYLFGKPGPL